MSTCNLRGVLTVVGSFSVLMTFGSLYTWGNMTTYVTSYMRFHLMEDITFDDTVWVLSAGALGLPIFMSLSGYLLRFLGLKLTLLISCLLMSGCQLLMWYVVKVSVAGFIVTFAASYASSGIAYMGVLLASIRWFPQHKGIVSGLIVGGFGIGSLVMTPIQTAFINPRNLAPDHDGYFRVPEVLENVPNAYILQSALFLAMQLLGILLISDSRKHINAEEEETRSILKSVDPSKYTEEQNNVREEALLNPEHGLTPSQMLKTYKFYIFWACMFLNCCISYYLSSMYKAYGQTFISDDHFLALIGSIASGFNFAGRLAWGKLLDKFRYKTCLMAISSGLVLLLSTLAFSPLGHEPMYALWVWLLNFVLSGMYVITPGGVTYEFGEKHGETNYGIVFSSQIFNAPLVAIITQFLSDYLHWAGTFTLLASFSFIALITSLFFKENQVLIGSG